MWGSHPGTRFVSRLGCIPSTCQIGVRFCTGKIYTRINPRISMYVLCTNSFESEHINHVRLGKCVCIKLIKMCWECRLSRNCWNHAGRFPNLDNDIEEGICQVIAHIWLKAEIEKLSRKSRTGASQSALKRLGEFFLHQIETDSSPIYGDGFRSGSAAVSTFGLRRTLERLRHTGRLP